MSSPLTPEERDELRGRLFDAAQLPWGMRAHRGMPGRWIIEEKDIDCYIGDADQYDARLIVEAVNALPRLLDQVDRLEARLSRCRPLCKWSNDTTPEQRLAAEQAPYDCWECGERHSGYVCPARRDPDPENPDPTDPP